MRRTDPIRFGDAWSEFIKSTPSVARKIAAARIPRIWPQLVGNRVAYYTKSVKVDNGVLTIYLTSAALKHELFMKRDAIKEHINREIGERIINVVLIK